MAALASQNTLVDVLDDENDSPESLETERCFKDPVWDLIKFDALICKIIDTPQFQRLRYLKQLGVSCKYLDFVWPGASHNRFEHCLGTAHLAQRLVLSLRARQPQLGITDRDVQCVTIAGLCHDLGHGPFSHVFDNHFIPTASGPRSDGTRWCHEEASEMMLDALVHSGENNVDLSEDKLNFIKDLIRGEPRLSVHNQPPEKKFLFEIVANKRNGIDVDKWDYIARDTRSVGETCTLVASRLIEAARVSADGQTIAYNWKDSQSVYELFYSRYSLHKRIYNHKTARAMEYMVVDALLAAEPVFHIADSINDPSKYLYITDSILEDIERRDDPRLAKSKKIIQDMRARRIPKRVEEKCLPWHFKALWVDSGKLTAKAVADMSVRLLERKHRAKEAERFVLRDANAGTSWKDAKQKHGSLLPAADIESATPGGDEEPLKEDDIIIDCSMLHFGMKDKDPMQSVSFWGKRCPEEIGPFRPDQAGYLRPENFQELIVRCYARDESKLFQVQAAFREVLAGLPSDDDPDTSEDMSSRSVPSTPAPSSSKPSQTTPVHATHLRRKSSGTPFATHPNHFNTIPKALRTPRTPSLKRDAEDEANDSPSHKRKRHV